MIIVYLDAFRLSGSEMLLGPSWLEGGSEKDRNTGERAEHANNSHASQFTCKHSEMFYETQVETA